ncbi:MAG: orotidine-5'-phosphate decarboxylase [Bacteroidetes bacterium]|nr:orotidine-5'-phosphate decarboxylase [Bacteroidota bacterium]
MTRDQLAGSIFLKKTFLCVGLDTDHEKIPAHLHSSPDPVFEFNKQIIDATKQHCIAYKLNTAFYEAQGVNGWSSLEKTIEYIDDDHFVIADAKRGDIGNTSRKYAQAFFNHFNVDAITVAPYMGEDSVSPFLEFEGKWVILLALTSNKGSSDFQNQRLEGNRLLYEEVIETSSKWGNADNMMYVVGATHPEELKSIRELIPDHFLLVPGVGAQGGDLQKVVENGMNQQCGLLVNASRSIIYASNDESFAEAAGFEALKIKEEMESLLTVFQAG